MADFLKYRFFIITMHIMAALIPALPGSAKTTHSLPPLPYSLPGHAVADLETHIEPHMQQTLLEQLRKKRQWRKLLDSQRMAVGLVDIADPKNIRYARVNGDVMMYAASLPKIAILLAAGHAFEDGVLAETKATTGDIEAMLRRSDNQAASRMLDRLGLDYVAGILTLKQYRFYDPDRGGGLWMGKQYAKTGQERPDPVHGILHGATVTQVCRFYYRMAMGQLISPERSRWMLSMLSRPAIAHKFVKTLRQRAPDALLFRKSGTWKIWHSDSVLVWGPVWRRYIAVALLESPYGDRILQQLIPVLETVLQAHQGLSGTAVRPMIRSMKMPRD